MGNFLSGWYGRRSSRPYFEELARLAVGDVAPADAPASALVLLLWGGVSIRLEYVPIGCMKAVPRLLCPRCNRLVRVLYFSGAPSCYRCCNARYRSHSEAPGLRAVRRARRIFMRPKVDYSRPGSKPRWMRWKTFERLEQAAEAVWPTILRDEMATYDLLARIDAPRRPQGRPRKVR